MIQPLERPIARSILLVLRLQFVLVVHLLDSALLFPAILLIMPWLTEEVDNRWAQFLARLTRRLHLPAMLRFRLIVLGMFWPSAVKDLGLALLWILVVMPGPAAKGALLGILLFTLLSSALLAYNRAVASIVGDPPTLWVEKELGYRVQSVHHGVLHGLLVLWLLGQGAPGAATVAVAAAGAAWVLRHFGVLVPLVMLVYLVQLLCAMIVLTPDGQQLGLMALALAFALLVSVPAIREQASRNFRRYRVMKWLERSQRG
jgi:hypothetical protein